MLERLDAAFTSQKRFVANAAHELRTPLTAMRTAIDVTLSKPHRTPEQLEEMAERVRDSTERAEATIEAMLTLATSELGATTTETLDLATAAEDALDGARATIDERKIVVDAVLEPASIHGDRVLLERMIANSLRTPPATTIPVAGSGSARTRGLGARCLQSSTQARKCRPSNFRDSSSPSLASATDSTSGKASA